MTPIVAGSLRLFFDLWLLRVMFFLAVSFSELLESVESDSVLDEDDVDSVLAFLASSAAAAASEKAVFDNLLLLAEVGRPLGVAAAAGGADVAAAGKQVEARDGFK
jgi:hypothetical protein